MLINGFLVQDTTVKYYLPKHFNYDGINAYDNHPLLGIEEPDCKKLSDLQMFKRLASGRFQQLDFISDIGLFFQYTGECRDHKIKTRILLIESEYNGEIMLDQNIRFASTVLGYEYSPLPLDDQIMTDLDYFLPLFKYHKYLNKYGLFDDYAKVKEFADLYSNYLSKGEIGDGLEEAYIFRISVVENM